MTTLFRPLPLLIGMGIVAIAASAGIASSDTGALRCDIAEHSQNGMRSIEASVISHKAISGEYRFGIRTSRNGNTSNINQGGAFSAPADEAVSLGQMMIDAGAHYSLDFSIIVEGETIACTHDGVRFT